MAESWLVESVGQPLPHTTFLQRFSQAVGVPEAEVGFLGFVLLICFADFTARYAHTRHFEEGTHIKRCKCCKDGRSHGLDFC